MSAPGPSERRLFCLRDAQVDALKRMLALHTDGPAAVAKLETWKVLVFDRRTRDIIAPLLTVHELRSYGVTLHLMIENERQAVPDVPAVYFVEATRENVEKILTDCKNQMYASYHVNFSSTISRELLEYFATESVKHNTAGSIHKIYDHYVNFASEDEGVFSLLLHDAFRSLNDPAQKDSDVEAYLGRIVDGLFDTVATASVMPFLAYHKGDASEAVAKGLAARLREHQKAKTNLFKETSKAFRRPLLIILDRSSDIAGILHHPWTYAALAADVAGLRLGKVNVDVHGSSGSSEAKTYTIERDDDFWHTNAAAPFPSVAENVEGALQKYKEEEAALKEKFGSDALTSEGAKNLATAVNVLPELQKRKRNIDMHTNIATSLLEKIKQRELDKYFSLETSMLSRKLGLQKLEREILAVLQGDKGTPEDKLRAYIIYFLACDVREEAAAEAEQALGECGAPLHALEFVKQHKVFRKHAAAVAASVAANDSGAPVDVLSGFMGKVGQGLNQLGKNVRSLVLGKGELYFTRVVASLVAGAKSEKLDEFVIADPKTGGEVNASQEPHTYDEAVVFVVGGGSFTEYHNIMDTCAGKHITYGSTDMPPARDFIRQLSALGGANAISAAQ